MAYLEDKILKGGEITKKGVFCEVPLFYIMLVPTASNSSSMAILNVKLSKTDDLIDFPFAVGVWNPVAVNKINVKSSDLTGYRIFWGAE